jgi:hypothetical protein
MKCFVHQSADAVGICRNCSRGVCAECAADRASGIACKNRCETAVDGMDALVKRNVAVGSKVSAVHWVQFAAFAWLSLYAAAMAVFSAFGDDRNWVLGIVLFVGSLFLGVCAFNILKWMQSVRTAT